jgi:nucleotide-binding universal stress UspA family protein
MVTNNQIDPCDGRAGVLIATNAGPAGVVTMRMGLAGDHRLAADIVRHARRSVLVVSPSELGSIGRVMLTADFGGSTIEADQCALSLLASDGQAELIHVTPALQLAPDIYQAWRRAYDNAVTELLDETRAALPRCSGSIPSRVTVGDAARVLVDIARRERVDLIALGRHARPNVSLGPVVESVLARAPCSVLVAP